jgi:hypothetical protein
MVSARQTYEEGKCPGSPFCKHSNVSFFIRDLLTLCWIRAKVGFYWRSYEWFDKESEYT